MDNSDSTDLSAEALADAMTAELATVTDRSIWLDFLDYRLQKRIPQARGVFGRPWTNWHAALDLVDAGPSGWKLVTDSKWNLRLGFQRG